MAEKVAETETLGADRRAVVEPQEIAQAARRTESEQKEMQPHTGAEMVDDFMRAIMTERYKPLPTGIEWLDRALDGGLCRQQLVILGAAPGAGKTALTQFIFETMAERGTCECIYCNFEMAREQLLARSMARMIGRGNGTTAKPLEILRGYSLTSQEREVLAVVAEAYKRAIAPRITYNPDGLTAEIKGLMAYLEREAERAELAGKRAPAVVIDYLQLLQGEPHEDAATTAKRAVLALKQYAMKHDTIVFAIVAHNRTSNKAGGASMDAARDTSAIEYSADLQMALAYTKILDRNEHNRTCEKGEKQEELTPDDLTPQEKQEVTLCITKNRFGETGKHRMRFYGAAMTFTDAETYRKPSGAGTYYSTARPTTQRPRELEEFLNSGKM